MVDGGSPGFAASGATGLGVVVRETWDGLSNIRMWGYLGWAETKRRYRRTVLGPFWATVSQAVFVLAIGFLYAGLWKQSVSNYLPYLTTGVICWALIAAMFNESCSIFSASSSLLSQMRFNLATLVAAMIWRNVIVFFHSVIVYIPVAFLFDIPINSATLLFLPGLFLLCANFLWLSPLIGMIGVRYRDMQQLFTNVIQISMFVSPVFWNVNTLSSDLQFVIQFNPFYHLLAVVRLPMLGEMPSLVSYGACVAMFVLGSLITLASFSRYRHRIIFWI